jgi:tetratricopeptide (TPR) repeat protein
MRPEHWLDQLPFYAAGQLAADDHAALEQHLRECASCRAAAAQWMRIAAEVRQQAAGRVYRLPSFPSHQLPLQEKKMNTAYRVPFPHTTPRRQPALTLIAAVLIAVLFAGGLFLLSGRDGHDPQSDTISGAAGQNASATPTLIATLPPTVIPTLVPGEIEVITATPIPTMLFRDMLPPAVNLSAGIRYEQQGWNNAGPATLAMALSYWGGDLTQGEAANWLKPNTEDKHVTPEQMIYYVNQYTHFSAITRLGGTTDLLRSLLAAGFPVIIQTGFQPEGEDWFGHYQLIVGYDAGDFYAYDSYRGAGSEGNGIAINEGKLDALWRQFNRTFIVVYPPASSALSLPLGAYIDPVYAINQALAVAHTDTENDAEDAWSWFNLGSSYATLNTYDQAMFAYDRALELDLPWRMLWYQYGPFEAYFYMDEAQQVIDLADEVISTTTYVEEAYYWRALAQAAQGDDAQAGEDLAMVFQVNPNFVEALAGQYHVTANPLSAALLMPSAPMVWPPTVVPPFDFTPTVVPPPQSPESTVSFLQLTATQMVDEATATAAAASGLTPTPIAQDNDDFMLTATQIVAEATGTAAAPTLLAP